MFKNSYDELYNSSPSVQEMAENIAQSESAATEVNKVTLAVAKEAIGKLKPKKSGVTGSYVSDALKNAPDLLFELFAVHFRSWLTHGKITRSLLACSFLPLVKSSLKDPNISSSYRAIAGSSLILKVFEIVVILLWGDRFSSDSLQFGYK